MKRLIRMMVATAALGVAAVAFADPEVTDVTAAQRYPWNGLVDISCKVSGIESGVYSFAVVAVDKDTNKEYPASQFTVEKGGATVADGEIAENGSYKLLWDARADMGQVVVERMTVRVTLEAAGVSAGMVPLWEGGPYWADRNIGAKKPEDYGLYFWWGDTTGHRPGYNFFSDNSAIYTYGKSVAELQSAGWVTSDGVLAPSHDAAHVKWGGAWRMPTKQEFDGLNNNCDWTWTTQSGVNGYVVRGRGAYASNSIFLPAAGYCYGASLYFSGSLGSFWSSVPDSDYDDAYVFYFLSDYHGTYCNYRDCGQSVRPVQGLAK